jgi:hypothetical protein
MFLEIYLESNERVGGNWVARGLDKFFGDCDAEDVNKKSPLPKERALQLNR